MRQLLVLAAAAAILVMPLHARAADAKPPADPSQPVTTARVGGSPADAAYRQAIDKSGADFRAARAACRAKPRAERGACMNTARADLKHSREEAVAAHNAAREEANAAHKAAREAKKNRTP
jgi:hypothetical protein